MTDATRDRILDQAAQLFLQYGYKRTTMEDIASAMGMSKASLYLRFSSKDDIFRAVSDRASQRVLSLMQQVLDSDLAPIPKLHRIFLASLLEIWDFCHQAPHAPELWLEVLHTLGDNIGAARESGRQMVARVITEGQEAGAFSPEIDASQAARLLQLAMQAFDVPYTDIDRRDQIETDVPQLLDLVIHGLRTHSCVASVNKDLQVK